MKKNDNTISSGNKNYSVFRYLNIISVLLAVYDAAASAVSYFVALWIRFDCHYTYIPQDYLMAWFKFMPVYAVVCVFVFCLFRLYQSIWKFASFTELEKMIAAMLILGVFHTAGITLMFGRMPIPYYVGGFMLQSMFSLAVRFAYRFVHLMRSKKPQSQGGRVMLIGAGDAGRALEDV